MEKAIRKKGHFDTFRSSLLSVTRVSGDKGRGSHTRWLSLSKPEGLKSFGLIILCFMFIISCSGGEKEKKKVASTNDEKKTVTTAGPELERTEVRWMYLDDSLRNICRPLNFILPWMASDERELPDTIYHEITRLPPFKYFAPLSFDKNNINDTLVSYSIKMNNSICDCEVIRYYEGDKNNKNFDGYRITEQVICNATSANYDLLNDTNDYSSDKVAEHGHDH